MTTITPAPITPLREPASGDRFDAIVIGSGAGGLTCANRLAQAGLRVLLAEKNEWLGGYSHGFSQDGFYWDHGGHIFLGYRLGGQAREVFQRLGLDKRVDMVPDTHDYQCIFPDESLMVPAEMTAAADVMAERFPEERDGIAKVLLIMERLIDETDMFVPSFRPGVKPGQRKPWDPLFEQFQRPIVGKLTAPLANMLNMPGRTLLRYQSRTMKDLLDEYLTDPKLKGYFAMLSAGISTGPGKLSAVIAGVFFVHALRTMWMPRGGFGALGQAMGQMFQERGGTIALNAEVARIIMENDRVAGIETEDGRKFYADSVVSNADARRTLLKMVEPRYVPADLRDKLPTYEVTPSIFQLHLGIDMDLAPLRQKIARLNFFYPYPDIDRAMAQFPAGNVEEAAFFLYVATFHQPEMAPPGMHSLKLEAYTSKHSKGIDWERDKEKIGDIFVRRSEQLIPGLSQHIVTRAYRTPLDLERDTGNSEGAFAGWAFTPEMLSRARPPQRTPVPGLYLCGHWTTPTAGVPWVMLGGYNTAGMVIADRRKARAAR
jgi:prolycopene isomerase